MGVRNCTECVTDALQIAVQTSRWKNLRLRSNGRRYSLQYLCFSLFLLKCIRKLIIRTIARIQFTVAVAASITRFNCKLHTAILCKYSGESFHVTSSIFCFCFFFCNVIIFGNISRIPVTKTKTFFSTAAQICLKGLAVHTFYST